MGWWWYNQPHNIQVIGVNWKTYIQKVGGTKESIESFQYLFPCDKNRKTEHVQVYGIDCISSTISEINLLPVSKLFPGIDPSNIQRPCGSIDVLVGFEYAAYHPIRQASVGNLLLLKNQFGWCIGGSHPLVNETTQIIVEIATVNFVTEYSTLQHRGFR